MGRKEITEFWKFSSLISFITSYRFYYTSCYLQARISSQAKIHTQHITERESVKNDYKHSNFFLSIWHNLSSKLGLFCCVWHSTYLLTWPTFWLVTLNFTKPYQNHSSMNLLLTILHKWSNGENQFVYFHSIKLSTIHHCRIKN